MFAKPPNLIKKGESEISGMLPLYTRPAMSIRRILRLKSSWQAHEDIQKFGEIGRAESSDWIPAFDCVEAVGAAAWVTASGDLLYVRG